MRRKAKQSANDWKKKLNSIADDRLPASPEADVAAKRKAMLLK